MTYKSWVKKLIISVSLFISFIIVFNFIIDPYSIFNTININGFNSSKNYISNDARTKFYSAKRANPNILLLGTSRTEHIHPNLINKYVDGKVYNLAIKGSGVTLHKKNLQYFIKHNDIKMVIYGLDLFSFNPASNKYNASILNTRYDNYYINDYIDVLFGTKALSRSIKTFKSNLKGDKEFINLNIGWSTNTKVYEEIKKGGIDFIRKNTKETIFKKIFKSKHMYNNSDFKLKNSIDKSLKAFDDIIYLCKKNDIKLYLFISPIYSEITDLIFTRGYGDTYNYWKESLSKYDNIYDFSGYNSITDNITNFVDGSHYNSKVAKLIIDRIFTNNSIKIPSDFGIILNNKKEVK